jgi:hypothetical protein
MDLAKALENLKHDTRMKEWVVKTGYATKEELQKVAQALPDSATDCEEVTLEDKPGFGD